MKTNIFSLTIFIISLTSCQTSIHKNSNQLLADEVKAQYFMSIEDTTISSEWVKDFNKKYLYDNTFQQIFTKNFKVYNPDGTYFSKLDGTMGKQEILKYLNWDSISDNYDELNEIVFFEKWYVDSNFSKFSKVVLGWSPVRDFYRPGKKDRIMRRKIVNIFPTKNKKGVLLGKNIFYECEIKDYCQYPFYIGFDKDKFIESVFDKIKKNKITAYDPIYLIDQTKKPINVEDILYYPKDKSKIKKFYDSICALIFNENWYFDKETLSIYKEVVSIGFVQWDKEKQKENILFFINFKK